MSKEAKVEVDRGGGTVLPITEVRPPDRSRTKFPYPLPRPITEVRPPDRIEGF